MRDSEMVFSPSGLPRSESARGEAEEHTFVASESTVSSIKNWLWSYREFISYSLYSLTFAGIPITAIFDYPQAAMAMGAASFISKIFHTSFKNHEQRTNADDSEDAIKKACLTLGVSENELNKALGEFKHNQETAVWNGIANTTSTAFNIAVAEILSDWLPRCVKGEQDPYGVKEDPAKQWLAMALGTLTAVLLIWNHKRSKAAADRLNDLNQIENVTSQAIKIIKHAEKDYNTENEDKNSTASILKRLNMNTNTIKKRAEKREKQLIKEQKNNVLQALKDVKSKKRKRPEIADAPETSFSQVLQHRQ